MERESERRWEERETGGRELREEWKRAPRQSHDTVGLDSIFRVLVSANPQNKRKMDHAFSPPTRRFLRAGDVWGTPWTTANKSASTTVRMSINGTASGNSAASSAGAGGDGSTSADLPFGLAVSLLIAATIFTALGLNVEKLAHRKLEKGATIFRSLGNWVWWIGFIIFTAAREWTTQHFSALMCW